jgi:hypothetical protein
MLARLVASDKAAGSCTQYPMMSRVVTRSATDDSTFKAAFRRGRLR